ncbi:hypothetical protein [Pseudomonas japonica]|uniref:hypothetical protein n=1 Tax=Pseudomonas japonica TaxID=256466 RepID=UPI0015E45C52|nr:hypothetical protein [Pseudomonas japonica]MBA1245818.1 hypothetical protein [Pseudomonas japonica]
MDKGKSMEISLKTLLASAVAVALGACSTGPTAAWPWADKRPCADTCTPKEAAQAFADAVGFCRAVQNYYEKHGFYATNSKFLMGAFGTLSGAVAAPLAGGGAKDAWAGLSGSTSALQTGFEEGFSSAVYVRRRASVASAGKEGILQYSLAETDNQRAIVAVAMAFNCSVAAADAESAALRAISNAQVVNPNPVSNARTQEAATQAQDKATKAAEAAAVAQEAAEQAQQSSMGESGSAAARQAAEKARMSANDAEKAAREAEALAKPK